jgi:SAM-dependent methyltransferase
MWQLPLGRSDPPSCLRPSGGGAVLDLGCGRRKFPGALGVDRSSDTDADMIFDLNERPYPLEDSSFDQIHCQDVLEHVDEPLAVLTELHRVGRDRARVHIRTPHFSSVLAYSDFTHRHVFSALAFELLERPLFEHYTEARFRVIDVRLDFWRPFRIIGIAALANRFIGPYERIAAHWFPAANIRAELEIVKVPVGDTQPGDRRLCASKEE